ncbi:MAG: hypothetical protein ACO1SV_00655 [Fimbriimonas sp.]
MKGAISLALAAIASSAAAQSTFQDARGESTLLFNRGGFAQIAFDKSSARVGFLYDVGTGAFYGFDLTGRLAGDTADLFKSNRLVDDTRVRLTYGFRLREPRYEALLRQVNEIRQEADQYADPLREQLDRVAILKLSDKDRTDKRMDLEEKAANASGEEREKLMVRVLRYREIDGMTPEGRESARKASLEKIAQIQDEIAKIETRAQAVQKEALTAQGKDKRRDALFKGNAIGKVYETLAIQLSGRSASYQFFDGTQPMGSQFSERQFEGWGASVVFNGLIPGARYGLSLGFERDNNIDDLSLRDIMERQTWMEGGVTRTTERKVSAYVGAYQEVDRAPLRADYVWWPGQFDRRIALTAFGRYDLRDDRSFRPGVGIFLTKPNAPTSVVGGMTLLFNRGKPEVAIVAGYNF